MLAGWRVVGAGSRPRIYGNPDSAVEPMLPRAACPELCRLAGRLSTMQCTSLSTEKRRTIGGETQVEVEARSIM